MVRYTFNTEDFHLLHLAGVTGAQESKHGPDFSPGKTHRPPFTGGGAEKRNLVHVKDDQTKAGVFEGAIPFDLRQTLMEDWETLGFKRDFYVSYNSIVESVPKLGCHMSDAKCLLYNN